MGGLWRLDTSPSLYVSVSFQTAFVLPVKGLREMTQRSFQTDPLERFKGGGGSQVLVRPYQH